MSNFYLQWGKGHDTGYSPATLWVLGCTTLVCAVQCNDIGLFVYTTTRCTIVCNSSLIAATNALLYRHCLARLCRMQPDGISGSRAQHAMHALQRGLAFAWGPGWEVLGLQSVACQGRDRHWGRAGRKARG